MKRAAFVSILLSGALACDAPPAPAPVAPVASLSIVVDGGAPRVFPPGELGNRKPDVTDGDHRAYWISSLSPEWRASMDIRVEDADHVVTSLASELDDHAAREPLVMVTRQGELRVALARRDDPMPAFHGRGGNRGRSGDRSRVQKARRIFLTSAEKMGP